MADSELPDVVAYVFAVQHPSVLDEADTEGGDPLFPRSADRMFCFNVDHKFVTEPAPSPVMERGSAKCGNRARLRLHKQARDCDPRPTAQMLSKRPLCRRHRQSVGVAVAMSSGSSTLAPLCFALYLRTESPETLHDHGTQR